MTDDDVRTPLVEGAVNYDDPDDRLEVWEQLRLDSTVMQLHYELLAQDAYMGMTLNPTVFGEEHADGRPNYRQTIVFETAEAQVYCVGDGRMTLNEQALWLAEFARLKGWL